MSLVTSDEMLEKLEVCVCSFSGLDSYQMGELGFFSLLSCPLLQLGWFCPLGWGPALAGQWGPAWSVNWSFAVLNHCCSLLTWITSKGHLLQSQTFYWHYFQKALSLKVSYFGLVYRNAGSVIRCRMFNTDIRLCSPCLYDCW